jgi:hypothetical protein
MGSCGLTIAIEISPGCPPWPRVPRIAIVLAAGIPIITIPMPITIVIVAMDVEEIIMKVTMLPI